MRAAFRAMEEDPDVIRAARHLLASRGKRAALAAEQRASSLEAEGNKTAAQLWRRIALTIDGIDAGRIDRRG